MRIPHRQCLKPHLGFLSSTSHPIWFVRLPGILESGLLRTCGFILAYAIFFCSSDGIIATIYISLPALFIIPGIIVDRYGSKVALAVALVPNLISHIAVWFLSTGDRIANESIALHILFAVSGKFE